MNNRKPTPKQAPAKQPGLGPEVTARPSVEPVTHADEQAADAAVARTMPQPVAVTCAASVTAEVADLDAEPISLACTAEVVWVEPRTVVGLNGLANIEVPGFHQLVITSAVEV